MSALDDLPRETAPGGLIETAEANTITAAVCESIAKRAEDLFGGFDALVIDEEMLDAVSPLITEVKTERRGTIICLVGRDAHKRSEDEGLDKPSGQASDHESLRRKLARSGISLITVEHGVIQALFGDAIQKKQDHGALGKRSKPLLSRVRRALAKRTTGRVSPEDVAVTIEQVLGLKRPRRHYRVKRRRR